VKKKEQEDQKNIRRKNPRCNRGGMRAHRKTGKSVLQEISKTLLL